MVTVLHYETNKEPDIYFGMTDSSERKIIKGLEELGNIVTRSPDSKWFGQSNPRYSIHHWDVKKKRG